MSRQDIIINERTALADCVERVALIMQHIEMIRHNMAYMPPARFEIERFLADAGQQLQKALETATAALKELKT